MGSYIMLEPILKDILGLINPLREDWETRLRIISDLREVVESVESLRGATVEPFGSFVSNLFSRWGDLDISIQLSNGSCISSAGKNLKQSLLGDLLRALRQKGGYRRLQFVAHARVPILKFESIHQNISCDISIDNLCGQMKSKFLFWVSDLDGRFHDMVLLVKEWAKAHDINNPKNGTLNSYSLSLLVIFHFQTCVPAIFPPLKDIYPGNLADDLKGLRANAERQIAEICAANIARFRSDKYRKINQSPVAHLFVSFLEKFCAINVKASELGVCPFTGRWEHIESNTRWLPNNHPLFIEDPFEQPQNSARAVSVRNLAKISSAFEMTHSRLISVQQNPYALVSLLARPHISKFLGGTPVRYPNYNNGQTSNFLGGTPVRYPNYNNGQTSNFLGGTPVRYPNYNNGQTSNFLGGTPVRYPNNNNGQLRTGHKNHKPTHSPSQAQRQSHNIKKDSRPDKSLSQQPVQHHIQLRQHDSQVQRIWRPKSDASQP